MTIKKPKLRLVKRKQSSLDEAAEPAHKVRYRMNAQHAASVKDRALTTYRKAQKDSGKEFELSGNTILRSVDTIDEYAETLVVHNSLTKETATLRVIRLTVLAKLLDTSYQTVWRWTSATDQLPEPVLTALSDRDRPVYHVAEAAAILRAIGEHLNQFKYYRKDHVGTRDRIFHDIDTLRETNYGDTSHGTETKSKRQSPLGKGIPRKIRRV